MGLTLDFTWLLCPCTTDHVVSILLYFVHTVNKFVLQMIGKLYMERIFSFTLLHILTGCCSAMCTTESLALHMHDEKDNASSTEPSNLADFKFYNCPGALWIYKAMNCPVCSLTIGSTV